MSSLVLGKIGSPFCDTLPLMHSCIYVRTHTHINIYIYSYESMNKFKFTKT